MATRKEQIAFIGNVATAAKASQAKWDVPASITIAQAIEESGWGQSKLAREANNFFGIKAKQGEDYRQFLTDEYYTVKPGDTLESIARQFDVKLSSVVTENNLNTKALQPGKQLKLVVLADFRDYPSPIESFDAHGKLLASIPRYQPAMAAADDPLAFAIQLLRCGYATDPNYPNELATLIKQHDLARFDSPAPVNPTKTQEVKA